MGARPCAEATALLLRKAVDSCDSNNPSILLVLVQQMGIKLRKAQPRESTVSNIVRRVIRIIRDEVEQGATHDAQDTRLRDDSHRTRSFGEDSHFSHVTADISRAQIQRSNAFPASTRFSGQSTAHGKTSSSASTSTQYLLDPEFKSEVIGGIEELLDEIKQADDQIAAYSTEHIHSREIILVNNISTGVHKFLTKAAQKRKFSVILVEGFPLNHQIAHRSASGTYRDEHMTTHVRKTLTSHGISVTIVPDSACFGLMPRITKVLLDAKLVLADGSTICASGSESISIAAKLHRVPVIALSAVYQISPEYPFQVTQFLDSAHVVDVSSYECDTRGHHKETITPYYDHVQAKYVDLYITNIGGNAPSSLHRVINDHYRQEGRGIGVLGGDLLA